jgi:hypothetical protein
MWRWVRTAVPYVLSLLLAWAGIWLGLNVSLTGPMRLLKAQGVPVSVATAIMVSWNMLHVLVPFLLACWLVWLLASRKSTPYRWGAVVLGGLALVVEVLVLLQTIFLTNWLGVAYDLDMIAWSGLLLPWALSLLIAVVAAEPYVSTPISPRQTRLAWLLSAILTVMVILAQLSPPGPTWTGIITWPLYAIFLVTFGVYWGTGLLLTVAGVSGVWPTVVPIMIWTLVVWYLVARGVLAWRASRASAPVGSDAGAEPHEDSLTADASVEQALQPDAHPSALD